jgi:ketosteroid isomerase-like protein
VPAWLLDTHWGMPDENLAVFPHWADCWNRGEIEAGLAECIDPDVEWIPIMAVLEGRTYHGHEGVREWAENLFRDWELFEIHVEEVRDLGGDRALALGSWTARGRASRLEFARPAAWLLDFADRRIARLQSFTAQEEAARVAGLR